MIMKMYDTPQNVEKYLNVPLECDCGRVHYAPIKEIDISSGALEHLPSYVKKYGYRRPYIICDETTYIIAAKRCVELLTAAGFSVYCHTIRHLGYNEATLGEIVINKPDDCDLMIGVGTGSITDILRYSSFKLGLPNFTIVTGAPMDGFSASVGIMNVNNLKATMPAHSTEIIIGDTDILAAAPYRMTVAGFGDLIGKLNALNDWRIAALVNGDHYCQRIDQLVTYYVNDIIDKADEIKERNPKSIGKVLSALLLTGATITLYGSSRPISGAEHHMSHYWEILGEQRGSAYAMHGEQVAVGTVLALMLTEEFINVNIDFNSARREAEKYDRAAWENEICRIYGNAAEAIINLETISNKNGTLRRLERIDVIESEWPAVREILEHAYPSANLRTLLKNIGSPADPKDIGVSEEVLFDTFLYCKETRARYTVYQLASDLGIMPLLASRVITRLHQLDAI